MSAPEVAPFLADKLGSLTHPDGTTLQFVQYSTFPGQHDEQQQQIKKVSTAVAQAIVHTLEAGGFSVVPTRDIQGPETLGSYQVVKVQCSACGRPLLELTPSKQGVVSMSAVAINALTHDCAI